MVLIKMAFNINGALCASISFINLFPLMDINKYTGNKIVFTVF